MIRITLLFLFLFICDLVTAQSILTSTIQWNVSQAMNVLTGEILDDPGYVVRTGKEQLEWINQDGTIRYFFSIKEVLGSWTNLNRAGEITYEIAGTEGNGTATFKKTNEDMRIRLLITKEAE